MNTLTNTATQTERLAEIEALFERLDMLGYISADDARALRLALPDLLAMDSVREADAIRVHLALGTADHYLQFLLDGVLELVGDEVVGCVPPHAFTGSDLPDCDIPF